MAEDTDNTACRRTKSDFDKYYDMLVERMDNPLKLISAAEKLINSAVNIAEGAFDGLLDLIQWPDSGNFMDDLLADLQYLRSCLYLAGESDYTMILDDTIAVLQAGGEQEDLPQEFLNSTKSDFQSKATGALEKVVDESIMFRLQAIEASYEQMLRRSGIYEILDFLDKIVTCMANLCDDALSYGTKVEEARDQLKIGMDDVANPDFANSEKIDPIKKQAFADSKASWQEAKDAITNISWP